MTSTHDDLRHKLPFDSHKLDELLDEAGIDVALVSSKHNLQYLLGGYRYFFFDHGDAIGVSRYLPILVYQRGRPENAAYIGNAMERSEAENGRFWTPKVETSTWAAVPAVRLAIAHLHALGAPPRIGIEFAFMPADAVDVLRAELPGAALVEAHLPLERLRARKTPAELALVEQASERVVAAVLATFAEIRAGMTKHEVVAVLRRHETARDLTFEYCLITAGTGRNRAPSDQVLRAGDIVSLDSGGRYRGYVGDLCRMGIIGEPDAEQIALLAEVDAIQHAARTPIRPGCTGDAIYAAVQPLLDASPHRAGLEFVAHGMGIITHEAPRLSGRGPVTYEGYDAARGLEPGMVLSIETTLLHPARGFVKLEDALAVTETGWQAFGDTGRGWNRIAAT